MKHEILSHSDRLGISPFSGSTSPIENQSFVCPFCGTRLGGGKGPDSRGRHVGRHMEEIAFTVVSKVYSDWEFYSDSSTTGSDHISNDPLNTHRNSSFCGERS